MLDASGLAAFAQHNRNQTHATCNQVAIADAGLIDAQAPGETIFSESLHCHAINQAM